MDPTERAWDLARGGETTEEMFGFPDGIRDDVTTPAATPDARRIETADGTEGQE